MEIILNAIIDDIPLIFYVFLRAFVIFVMSLGTVYIFGRMLDLVNSDKGRNAIALLVSLVLSYISILIYDTKIIVHAWEIYWRTFLYSTSSIILYVLIGWRLFDRVDNFLDKRFAPDNGPPKNKTKKVKNEDKKYNKRSYKKRK